MAKLTLPMLAFSRQRAKWLLGKMDITHVCSLQRVINSAIMAMKLGFLDVHLKLKGKKTYPCTSFRGGEGLFPRNCRAKSTSVMVRGETPLSTGWEQESNATTTTAPHSCHTHLILINSNFKTFLRSPWCSINVSHWNFGI